jgi:hypothetical protein
MDETGEASTQACIPVRIIAHTHIEGDAGCKSHTRILPTCGPIQFLNSSKAILAPKLRLLIESGLHDLILSPFSFVNQIRSKSDPMNSLPDQDSLA